MKQLQWIFIIAMVMTLPSCFLHYHDDTTLFGCIRGSGQVVSDKFDLESFDGIRLNVPAEVFITQGNEQIVEIEGYENLLDRFNLDVRNGIWNIEVERCVRNTGNLKVYITTPYLNYITINGSGSVVSDNILLTDKIELKISGSGDMDLGIEAEFLDGIISGSGKMRIEGISDFVDFRISGSGDYRAFNLDTRRTDIVISGSGDAEVNVSENLKVRISGSGDVFYKGNPSLDISVSGSGDVIDAN